VRSVGLTLDLRTEPAAHEADTTPRT
jgi:hypothetical protein